MRLIIIISLILLGANTISAQKEGTIQVRKNSEILALPYLCGMNALEAEKLLIAKGLQMKLADLNLVKKANIPFYVYQQIPVYGTGAPINKGDTVEVFATTDIELVHSRCKVRDN